MRKQESLSDRQRSACVAVVAILALVTAPFCAPLCAARSCAWSSASGDAQASDCHHGRMAEEAAGSNGLNAQHVSLAAETGTNCNPPEAQPAMLSAAKSRFGLFQTSESAPDFLSGAFGPSRAFLQRADRMYWLQSRTSIGRSDTPSATTVLRI